MTLDEIILQLKQDQAFADVKEDYYRKKIAEDSGSITEILTWASYAHEFEVRSNTLYGVIRQLERVVEN